MSQHERDTASPGTKAAAAGPPSGQEGSNSIKAPPPLAAVTPKDTVVQAVFLKRYTFAGPGEPGGCHTYLPGRKETRPGRRGKRQVVEIPPDRKALSQPAFESLRTRGFVVSEAAYAKLQESKGGDA